jgi:hypothetical protein
MQFFYRVKKIIEIWEFFQKILSRVWMDKEAIWQFKKNKIEVAGQIGDKECILLFQNGKDYPFPVLINGFQLLVYLVKNFW